MDNQLQTAKREFEHQLERSGQKILGILPDPPEEFLRNLDEETWSKLLTSILHEEGRRTSEYNKSALEYHSRSSIIREMAKNANVEVVDVPLVRDL